MKTVVLDTNIFIRFLIQDIAPQFEKANQLFESIEKLQDRGFVSILAVNEVIWILHTFYNLKREIYLPQLIQLLALKNIKITEVKKNVIMQVLELMNQRNIDFTDAYLFCTKGDKEIFSFDQDFKKLEEPKLH